MKCAFVLALTAVFGAATPPSGHQIVDPAWQVLKKGRVDAIAISPDGKIVAVFCQDLESHIYLWDRKTGKEVSRLAAGGIASISWLGFTPDGKKIIASHGAFASDGSPGFNAVAHVWDLGKEGRQRVIRLHAGQRRPSKPCAILDNKTLLLGGADEVAVLFDIDTGKRIAGIAGKHEPTLLTVSRDKRWLLTAGRDHSLCVWDLRTRKLACRLHEHIDEVRAVAISADGKWCASATDRRLWVFDRAKESELARTPTTLQDNNRSCALSFTPDGKTLVATASGPRFGLEVWDWQISREVRGGYLLRSPIPFTKELRKDEGFIWDAALAPDGRTLFTLGMPPRAPGGARSVVQVWNLGWPVLSPKAKR